MIGSNLHENKNSYIRLPHTNAVNFSEVDFRNNYITLEKTPSSSNLKSIKNPGKIRKIFRNKNQIRILNSNSKGNIRAEKPDEIGINANTQMYEPRKGSQGENKFVESDNSQAIEFYNTQKIANDYNSKGSKNSSSLIRKKRSIKPKRRVIRRNKNIKNPSIYEKLIGFQEDQPRHEKDIGLDNLVILSKPLAMKNYMSFVERQQSSKGSKDNFFQSSTIKGNRSLSQIKQNTSKVLV